MLPNQPETAAELEASRLIELATTLSCAEVEDPIGPVRPEIGMVEGSKTFMISQNINGQVRKIRVYLLPGGEAEMIILSYDKQFSIFKQPSMIKRFLYEDLWGEICRYTFGERKR